MRRQLVPVVLDLGPKPFIHAFNFLCNDIDCMNCFSTTIGVADLVGGSLSERVGNGAPRGPGDPGVGTRVARAAGPGG